MENFSDTHSVNENTADDFYSEEFIQKIQNSRNELTVSDDMIFDNGICIDYENISEIPEGRFTVMRDGIRMDTLYIPCRRSEYIFVVLSGARTLDGVIVDVPKFHMWSWQKRLDINYLYIEDPMYFKYIDPILKIGWYFGDAEHDYRRYTADLIEKICGILGFPNDKIILYGISAGGTAAGFVAGMLDGSTAIINNPQIDFKSLKYTEEFTNITGLDILKASEDGNRNDLISVVKKNNEHENKSTFLFMFNGFSKEDISFHFAKLAESFGLQKSSCGLNRLDDNVYALIYLAEGFPSPHSVPPQSSLMKFIINTAAELKKFGYTDFLQEKFAQINNFYYEISYFQKVAFEESRSSALLGQSRISGHILLSSYITARIDIKNKGKKDSNNDIEITNISDENIKISVPNWFCKNGKGYVLQSKEGYLKIEFVCINSGVLEFALRGKCVIDKNTKQRIPIWIDFQKFSVNNKVIFDNAQSVWHDKPFRYSKKVSDGEKITVKLSWIPYDINKGYPQDNS